uniref:Uncharacterized protein n=1 Tax=Knipowitschia caucasica TaxID=637954 RepID=A0AAV2KIY9_KNICA
MPPPATLALTTLVSPKARHPPPCPPTKKTQRHGAVTPSIPQTTPSIKRATRASRPTHTSKQPERNTPTQDRQPQHDQARANKNPCLATPTRRRPQTHHPHQKSRHHGPEDEETLNVSTQGVRSHSEGPEQAYQARPLSHREARTPLLPSPPPIHTPNAQSPTRARNPYPREPPKTAALKKQGNRPEV